MRKTSPVLLPLLALLVLSLTGCAQASPSWSPALYLIGPLLLLVSACATPERKGQPPVVVPSCPKPAPVPPELMVPPRSDYSESAQRDMQAWRQKLTGLPHTSEPSKD